MRPSLNEKPSLGDFKLEEGLDRELENILNHPAPAYGELDYWNARYRSQRGSIFEWFQPWPVIKPVISKHLPPSRGHALVIGCGNSSMSSELLAEFARVTSIDISDEVISQMKEQSPRNGALEWMTMDCTTMAFANGVFDAVFDKGTFDTLMCYDNGAQLAERMVRESARVLRAGALMFIVSYGIVKTRKKFFDTAGLALVDIGTVTTPGIPTNPFIYVLKAD